MFRCLGERTVFSCLKDDYLGMALVGVSRNPQGLLSIGLVSNKRSMIADNGISFRWVIITYAQGACRIHF